MGTTGMEKSAQDLLREIDELHRQQRQITERLYDPRGLRRRGGPTAAGPRSFAANGGRQRGLVRPADRINAEDQPPAKRRLSSAVVKLEDGEIIEDVDATNDGKKQSTDEENLESGIEKQNEDQSNSWHHGSFRRDGNQRSAKRVNEIPPVEHVPRVLPKNEDPSLVSRNKRILGQLLGTLEKFRKEDKQISETDAYIQRSNALQRAEQRAREESERLRQQEREQIAEKRRRDLVLRARVAAKAEEKKLELLFLKWTEHHKKLSNFIRTKAEPAIYYMPKKPLDEDPTSQEQREQAFLEWKTAKREELSEYQKQVAEQYLGNVEKELERWQNARKQRRVSNDADLQETMDKELDSHRLEHGPKTRKIPGGDNNEDEDDDDDVEDINVGEDDMMDDVLGVEDSRRGEESAKPEAGDANDHPETLDQ